MNTRLLLLITACALPSNAFAQAPAQPLDALFACESVTDSVQRLACMDAAVAALRNDTDAGNVVAIHREEVEAAEEATFGLSLPGFSLPSLPRFASQRAESTDLVDAAGGADGEAAVSRNDNGQIDRIDNLAIERITFSPLRRAIITLENGQVWRQLDSDSVRLPRRIDISGGASIRRAALGSYMLRVDGHGRWIRVRRTL